MKKIRGITYLSHQQGVAAFHSAVLRTAEWKPPLRQHEDRILTGLGAAEGCQNGDPSPTKAKIQESVCTIGCRLLHRIERFQVDHYRVLGIANNHPF